MEQQFETAVKTELQSMDQRLYDLEEKMTSIDTKLSQVVDAILGNPLTKAGGFIKDIEVLKEKFEKLELTVQNQEDFKKKIYWAAAIIVFIVLSVSYVTAIYSNITRH